MHDPKENNSHAKFVVTIDGPAGSGKSTVSKLLAEKFLLYQIDSGALYRSITYLGILFTQKKKLEILDVVKNDDFKEWIQNSPLKIKFNNRKQIIMLHGKNIEPYIRGKHINSNIKVFADNVFIRNLVNSMIYDIGKKYDIITDGRDMGTLAFPKADLKFYLTASLNKRAERRFAELSLKNKNLHIEDILDQIKNRDAEDHKRKIGKLKKASGAILIDTSSMKIDKVVETIAAYLKKKNIHLAN